MRRPLHSALCFEQGVSVHLEDHLWGRLHVVRFPHQVSVQAPIPFCVGFAHERFDIFCPGCPMEQHFGSLALSALALFDVLDRPRVPGADEVSHPMHLVSASAAFEPVTALPSGLLHQLDRRFVRWKVDPLQNLQQRHPALAVHCCLQVWYPPTLPFPVSQQLRELPRQLVWH